MLVLASDDADERNTLCGASQDSCSTITMLSSDDTREAEHQLSTSANGVESTAYGVTLPLPAITECDLYAAVAVKYSRLEHVFAPSLSHGVASADELTLQLRWRVLLPSAHPDGAALSMAAGVGMAGASGAAGAVGPVMQLPSIASLHSSDGLSATGRRGVLLSKPVYLTFPVPQKIASRGDGGINQEARTLDPHTGQSRGPKVVLSLPVGRALLRQCLSQGSTLESGHSQVEDLVETSISRQHAEVTLIFQAVSASSSAQSGTQLTASPSALSCRSVDVVDLVSNTFVHGVPLCRHHRYHFPLRRGTLHCMAAPFSDESVRAKKRSTLQRGYQRLISIDLGRHASLEICHVTADAATDSSTDALPDMWNEHDGVADSSGDPWWNVHERGHSEVEMGEEAVLLPKKSKSTTPSSAVATTASSEGSRQRTLPSTATTASRKRMRQTIPLPTSAVTVASSSAATAQTVLTSPAGPGQLEDVESTLMAHLPSWAGEDSPAGENAMDRAPLPRRPRQKVTTSLSVTRDGVVNRVMGSCATYGKAPATNGQSENELWSPSPLDSSSSSSVTSASTPPSLRNSTWTETFVESLVDDDPKAFEVVASCRHRGSQLIGGGNGTIKRRAFDPDESVQARAPVARATPDEKRVIFTTGLQLDDKEEKACHRLGISLNPDLRRASQAEVLVVQRPLIRSVKLLTVLPYVRAVVSRQWLDAVIACAQEAKATTARPAAAGTIISVREEDFLYSERRSSTSIEGTNQFSLAETLRVPPAERQRLLSDHTFFVHRLAKPQDPPLNDLRTVITASGGRITRQLRQATVVVLPERQLGRTAARQLEKELAAVANADSGGSGEGPLLIRPDDLFRAVLQQSRLRNSTASVYTGASQASQATDASGKRSGRRSAARAAVTAGTARSAPRAASRRYSTGGKGSSARKTPHAATGGSTQRQRPSTRNA